MSSPMSMYYPDYRKSRLTAQSSICESLRGTQYRLDSNSVNPMTVRLLLTLDALTEIEKCVEEYRTLFNRLNHPSNIGSGTQFLDMLTADTSSSGTFSLVPPNYIKSPIPPFEMIYTYKYLHAFYANGGSSLDRLTYELNQLYALRISPNALTYASLYTRHSPKSKNYKKPLEYRPRIEQLLSGQNAIDAYRFTKYRNRQMHDGIIEVECIGPDMYLPLYKFETDAQQGRNKLLNLCQDQFSAIEMLIDEAYQMVSNELQAKKTPPFDS